MSVNFAAARKEAERKGLIGSSDYFKVKEGANKLRLLSECLPHAGKYKGNPTFKWLCYVLDRGDGKVKPFFMAHTIYKQIEALQEDPDYAFESVPMPYDITVNAKGAGTKEVEYTVVPARQNTPMTKAETADFLGKKPLGELQDALRSKAGEDDHDAPRFDPETVPTNNEPPF